MSHLERVVEYIIKFPSQYKPFGDYMAPWWKMLWKILWAIPSIISLIVFCISAYHWDVQEGADVWKEYM